MEFPLLSCPRGVFRSVVDLRAAINRFVAETNNDPSPLTGLALRCNDAKPTPVSSRRRQHHNVEAVRQMPVLGQWLTIPHNVAWSAFIPMPDIPSNAFLLHLDS
jgi:hypothetical protein